MEITQIMIGGVLIQDPMTLLTDLILAAQCLILAFWLWQKGNHQPVARWIVGFFVMLGIGSIEGGIVNHGWYYLFGPGWKLPMVLIVGSSLPFLMVANAISIQPLLPAHTFRLLLFVIALEFVGFLIYLTTLPIETIDFKSMVPHLAVGLLLFVTMIQVYALNKDPHPARNLMLWGIVALVPVGIVNILKISPDKWFNMYDLVHVLLMLPIYLFYRAGLRFSERTIS